MENGWRLSGRPASVVVRLDPMLRGRNYVATLVDGNNSFPPGQVVWKGKLDQNVPGIVIADEICAEHGFLRARWVNARIIVSDAIKFRDELVNPKDCPGFPVTFTPSAPRRRRPRRRHQRLKTPLWEKAAHRYGLFVVPCK